MRPPPLRCIWPEADPTRRDIVSKVSNASSRKRENWRARDVVRRIQISRRKPKFPAGRARCLDFTGGVYIEGRLRTRSRGYTVESIHMSHRRMSEKTADFSKAPKFDQGEQEVSLRVIAMIRCEFRLLRTCERLSSAVPGFSGVFREVPGVAPGTHVGAKVFGSVGGFDLVRGGG